MKTTQPSNFEKQFMNATTITALRDFLKQLKMEKLKLMKNASASPNSLLIMDEQLKLVHWELKRLREMQSKGRFRAYYAFLKMLDEHYPYKTPVIKYKYILDDGVREFKREILSNMLHLSPPERVPYLLRVQYEMEGLLKNVFVGEDVLLQWCRKYNTSESEIFGPAASGHRNKIFEVLNTAKPASKIPVEIFAGEDEPDTEEYDIQNDFYNVFYGRAIRSVLGLVVGQIRLYDDKQEAKSTAHSRAEIAAETAAAKITVFEDLFQDKSVADRCLQMLKEGEYPLIGEQDNYIGKLKGGLCVWIAELQRQSLIRHESEKVYAALLQKRFSGLAPFHFSLFGKTNNRAEKRYRDIFRQKIERIMEHG